MEKYHYQLTKYPQMFDKVYWGRFKSNPMDYIFENRNKFIEEFNIKNFVSNPPKYIRKYIDPNTYDFSDHQEVYDNGEQYVVVISPYEHEEYKKVDTSLGWQKYDDLYNETATTYIMTFNKRR